MPTVEKAASEYTDYVKKRASVVGRADFSASLFNSLVLQSSVGRGLGNKPEEPPAPVGGDYGVLTEFSNTQPLIFPTFTTLPSSFTIELFFKYSDSEECGYLWNLVPNSYFGMNISGGILEFNVEVDTYAFANIGPVLPNIWHHTAVSYDGSNWYTSIDGVTTPQTLISPRLSGLKLFVGTFDESSEENNNFDSGSISNFRISNTARYTTDFTVPTLPLQSDGNTLLLLLAKSASTVGVDSSSYKRVAEGTCGWAPGPISYTPPFEDYGVLTGFDAPDTVLWYPTFGDLGTNFTVEFFFKVGQIVNGECLWYISKDAGNIDYLGMYFDVNTLVLDQNSASAGSRYLAIAYPSENIWYHVAVTRNGNTWYTSVNGSTTEAFTEDIPTLTNSSLCIGGYEPSNSPFTVGSISNFRISNFARYTDTNGYVPPSLPMTPAETDLILLLAKTAEPFADSSSYNRTPTKTCGWAPGPISYTPP